MDDPLLGELLAAIGGKNVPEFARLLALCDERRLILARIAAAKQLTVFGHVVVSQSDPELLDVLFRGREMNVNLKELCSNNVTVPLIHLAARAGNMEAVKGLCKSPDIDLVARDTGPNPSTVLHMAVRGGEANVVRHILDKARLRLNRDSPEFARLLNGEDSLGMTALHHAAWQGHEEIVAHLLNYEDIVNVNASRYHGFTALHLASWNNRLAVVQRLLACPRVDLLVKSGPLSLIAGIQRADGLSLQGRIKSQESHLRNIWMHNGSSPVETFRVRLNRRKAEKSPFLYPDLCNGSITALHCAAFAGHAEIVHAFIGELSSKQQGKKIFNVVDEYLMSPLYYAIIRGDASVVEVLLENKLVRGNLEERRMNLSPLDIAYFVLGESIDLDMDLDIQQEYKEIIAMLWLRPDVKGYMENLYRDRQVFVDATSAILVGAALIASITFAGWLQPPLGYQPYYDDRDLIVGPSVPPDTFASYAAVKQHQSVRIFWMFNSLSFFFAIATVLTGACAVLPGHAIAGKAAVENIRLMLYRTSFMLSFSVFFVLGAFVAAGFASLPPELRYYWGMTGTSVVGGVASLIVLYSYYKRMFRLMRVGNIRGEFKQKVKNGWTETMGHGFLAREEHGDILKVHDAGAWQYKNFRFICGKFTPLGSQFFSG